MKKSRTVWKVDGIVKFLGKASIGHGSRINVGKNGEVIFGDNFIITAETHVVANKKINFGNDVLISWQCLFMDTDFHKIYQDGVQTNPDREIIVGNHVWIGCRNTILKGTTIPDHSIVAAGSLLTKKFYEKNTIIAGNPAVVVRDHVSWKDH